MSKITVMWLGAFTLLYAASSYGCSEHTATDTVTSDTIAADRVMTDQANFSIAAQRGDIAAQCKYAKSLETDANVNDKDPLSPDISSNMRNFQAANCYR